MPLQWVDPNKIKDQTKSPLWKGISWSSNENTIDMVPTNVGLLVGIGNGVGTYVQLFFGYDNSGLWYRNCSVQKQKIGWVKIAGNTSNETLLNQKVDWSVYRAHHLVAEYDGYKTTNTWCSRWLFTNHTLYNSHLYIMILDLVIANNSDITQDVVVQLRYSSSTNHFNWDGSCPDSSAYVSNTHTIIRVQGTSLKHYGCILTIFPWSADIKSLILKLYGLTDSSIRIMQIRETTIDASGGTF